jgi:Helix-turn-helix domain
MTDFDRTARPDVLVAVGDEFTGPPGAAGGLSARAGGEDRRAGEAVVCLPLMTAADAAAYARVDVETILRAVRAGEVHVAGYVGRSPRTSRDALSRWLATRSAAAAPASPQPRRGRGRKASDAVGAAWQALG